MEWCGGRVGWNGAVEGLGGMVEWKCWGGIVRWKGWVEWCGGRAGRNGRVEGLGGIVGWQYCGEGGGCELFFICLMIYTFSQYISYIIIKPFLSRKQNTCFMFLNFLT